MSKAAIYSQPGLPHLLTLGSFLYVLNVTSYIFQLLINAGIVGEIFIGIVYGPPLSGILEKAWVGTFIDLGYIGLVLIVFEGGLTTDLSLLLPSLTISISVAVTGIIFPIGLSILFLYFGLSYSFRAAFAAGANLCSTSLGTTFAVLTAQASTDGGLDMRRTRVGTILLSAAIMDDVVGLIMASIIPSLDTSNGKSSVGWVQIVRPILASLAFSLLIPPLIRFAIGPAHVHYFSPHLRGYSAENQHRILLLILVGTIGGFIAAAHGAGASDLLGAYIAGCVLSYLSDLESSTLKNLQRSSTELSPIPDSTPPQDPSPPLLTFHTAFGVFLAPLQNTFLSPLFFASIGTSIPFLSLWKPRIIWRGIVYSALMTLAKLVAGLWLLFWPTPSPSTGSELSMEPSRRNSALFLGLALVARGEIALLIAQLARPVLGEELYLVVLWATLVCTIGGAVGVGGLLSAWKRRRGRV